MTEKRTQKGEAGGSIRELIERRKRGTEGLIPTTPYVNPNAEEYMPSETKPKQEPFHQPVMELPMVSHFIAEDFVTKIFSIETRYENSRRPVLIDRGFKNILDILSQLSHVDVSQMLNNILREFLQFDGILTIMPELEEYIQKQQRSISLSFKSKERNNG